MRIVNLDFAPRNAEMQKMESAIRGKGFNSANWKPGGASNLGFLRRAAGAFYLAVSGFWTVLAQVVVFGNVSRYA